MRAKALPTPQATYYVRLDGEVRCVVVQPYDARLVREFRGTISARDVVTGVYRNFFPEEFNADRPRGGAATEPAPPKDVGVRRPTQAGPWFPRGSGSTRTPP